MTQIKPSEVDLLKSLGEVDPPPGTLSYHLTQVEKEGKTVINCPHGHGFYVVKLQGSQWYNTPEVIFCPNKNCPPGYGTMRDYPSMYQTSIGTHSGRVIPIAGSIWAADPKRPGMWRACYTPDDFLKMARQFVRLILSGTRLYEMRCGEVASANNSFR